MVAQRSGRTTRPAAGGSYARGSSEESCPAAVVQGDAAASGVVYIVGCEDFRRGDNAVVPGAPSQAGDCTVVRGVNRVEGRELPMALPAWSRACQAWLVPRDDSGPPAADTYPDDECPGPFGVVNGGRPARRRAYLLERESTGTVYAAAAAPGASPSGGMNTSCGSPS